MRRPSPAQLALLKEMAAGHERHIIYYPRGLRTSWVQDPSKRQIAVETVRALEAAGFLTDRDGTTAWWLTDKGHALAKAEQP